jgi:hypothetical protein
MPGTHVILIDQELEAIVKEAGRQIAGLFDLLLGGKRYLEDKRLTDYTGGVFIYTPKARRGYLEPAPIARVVHVHLRIDPAFATIIGLWLPERQQGWGIPPASGTPSVEVA